MPPELPHAAPATQAELFAALREFAAQGVDLIIVSGGDGTLRDVTSLLPQIYGERLPRLSLLAAGNANVVAADVGTAGYGNAALEQVMKAVRDDRFSRRVSRPLLRVRWPGLATPPVPGFVAGAAVLTRATRHANEKILAHGVTHKASVLVTVLNAVWRAARGRPGWLGAETMEIAIDNADALAGARFLFFSTTLHKLMLGFWPFWGGEGSVAPLRYLDIGSPPRKLWRSLRRLLRGRPSAFMLANGYRSGRAERIRIQCPDPLIIDGEVFVPGADAIVELDIGPDVEFLTP